MPWFYFIFSITQEKRKKWGKNTGQPSYSLIPAIREEKASKITTKKVTSYPITTTQTKQRLNLCPEHDQRITPRAFGLQPNTTASSLLWRSDGQSGGRSCIKNTAIPVVPYNPSPKYDSTVKSFSLGLGLPNLFTYFSPTVCKALVMATRHCMLPQSSPNRLSLNWRAKTQFVRMRCTVSSS